MKVEFKPFPHTVKEASSIIEVWINGNFVATITPDTQLGAFRVLSRHVTMQKLYDPAFGVDIWQFTRK